MENQESKYNLLITRLRNTNPVAGDAGLMTDEIMLAIGQNKRSSSRGIVFWLRPLMTAAALFLFGLFLYQSDEEPVVRRSVGSVKPVKFTYIKKNCSGTDANVNFQDKQNLVNQYLCYMKSNRIENEESKALYLKYLGKFQLNEIQ